MSSFLDLCDKIESHAREFVAANPNGGAMDIPRLAEEQQIAVAVTMSELQDAGYDVAYKYDEKGEWLELEKKAPPHRQFASYGGGDSYDDEGWMGGCD